MLQTLFNVPVVVLVLQIKDRDTFFVALSSVGVLILVIHSFIYPVIIWPFTNTFEPLQEGSLRSKIQEMADKLEVSIGNIAIVKT